MRSACLVPGNRYCQNPKGLWSNGSTMWVADHGEDKIYAYNLHTGARDSGKDINTLRSAGNRRPAALWSDGSTMWVSDDQDGKIYAYDLGTFGNRISDQEFDTLKGVGNRSPKGIWSDGATMYVADNEDGKLYRYSMPENALLRSLEISDGEITPSFTANNRSYTARVPNTVANITVDPTAAFSDAATVTIGSGIDADPVADGHQVSLGLGANLITVSIQNGFFARTYRLTITKVDVAVLTSNADLSSLNVTGGDFGPIRNSVYSYSTGVATDMESTTLTALPSESKAEVSINPADADRNTSGHQLDLSTGRNFVTVTVTSTDAKVTKVYYIQVNRATEAVFGWNSVKDFETLWGSTTSAEARLWSDGETMWVADYHDQMIYAFDLQTHQRLRAREIDTLRAAGNHEPTGIWSDGKTMWVVDYLDQMIYAYNLDTGERDSDKEINMLADKDRHPMGIWSDGKTMWVADYWDEKIYAYNLDSGERDSGKDINSLDRVYYGPLPVGVWSDGETMWVTDYYGAGRIYAYDVKRGSRVYSRDITGLWDAGNRTPSGLWSDGETMWVYDDVSNKIFAYNMPTAPLLESLSLDNIDIGAFNVGRLHYAVNVPSTTASTTIAASAKFSGSTLAISPSGDADPNTAGHQVNLSTGNNTITVKVTLGYRTKTYNISVNRTTGDTVPDGVPLSSSQTDTKTQTDTVSETITETETESETETETGLTARFEGVPGTHDALTDFTFELHFSENVNLSYKPLRDHAFDVTGGEVIEAKRLQQGSNQGWRIKISPTDTTDITITLAATTDCTATAAICTHTDEPLTNTTTHTVTAPPT